MIALVALLLTADPSLSSADALSPTKVDALRLRVPAAWSHSESEGSHRYEAPSKDATFELSVFKVSPQREGQLCLSQLLEALGPNGWDSIVAGKAPAARRATVETSQVTDKDGQVFQVETQTLSYVGCNGSTKWALTMTMNAEKKGRFERLAAKVIESLTYAAK